MAFILVQFGIDTTCIRLTRNLFVGILVALADNVMLAEKKDLNNNWDMNFVLTRRCKTLKVAAKGFVPEIVSFCSKKLVELH